MKKDITVADLSKYLSRRKANYEKKLASPIESERNTAHRMVRRVQDRIDSLFDYQESIKAPQGETAMFGGGGRTPPEAPRRSPWDNLKSAMKLEGMPTRSEMFDRDLVKIRPEAPKWDIFTQRAQGIEAGKVQVGRNAQTPIQVNHLGQRTYKGLQTPQETIAAAPPAVVTPETMLTESSQDPVWLDELQVEATGRNPRLSPISSFKGIPTKGPEKPTLTPRTEHTGPTSQAGAAGMPVTKQNKWDKFGEFGLSIAPYLAEYATRNNAINKMQAPTEPTYIPPIHLNTALDTGADQTTAQRMMRTRQLNAERYAPNSQALMGEYGKATADNAGMLNQLSQQRNNHRAQMENAQVGANQEITGMNVQMSNWHDSELNQFMNDRVGAKAGNATNLLQKVSYAMAEGRMKDHDIKRLRVMMAKYPKDIQDALTKILNGEG